MACGLDIQSLPSLEKFDSQLLDRLLRANPGEAHLPPEVFDEAAAPDTETALQHLMSGYAACSMGKLLPGEGRAPPQQAVGSYTHPQHQYAAPPPAAGADMHAMILAAAHLGNAGADDAAGAMPLQLQLPLQHRQQEDEYAAGGGSGGNNGGGGGRRRRRNRASRLDELIKAEDDDDQSCGSDDNFMPVSNDSSQSPSSKRRRTGCGATDDCAGSGLTISADMDEGLKARIRREKNRIAARKCRAKKVKFMSELQVTLRDLMRKNEEYKMQVVAWHKMFSREVRLREAMKRVMGAMWQGGASPVALTGCTANDVIIGLESGTMDVNALVHALSAVTASGSVVAAGEGAALTPGMSHAAVLAGMCEEPEKAASAFKPSPLPAQLSNASEVSAASAAIAGQVTTAPGAGSKGGVHAAAADPASTTHVGGGWLWGDTLPDGAFAGLAAPSAAGMPSTAAAM